MVLQVKGVFLLYFQPCIWDIADIENSQQNRSSNGWTSPEVRDGKVVFYMSCPLFFVNNYYLIVTIETSVSQTYYIVQQLIPRLYPYSSLCIYSSKPAPPERIPWAKLRAEQAEREAAKWKGKTTCKIKVLLHLVTLYYLKWKTIFQNKHLWKSAMSKTVTSQWLNKSSGAWKQ